MNKKADKWLLPCWCLAVSFTLLALGSKNSFLYPMNDWVDVNCFFTVGRGILRGKMPYLDLFEQKGPLLYLEYAFGALISRDSFTGVYAVEGLLTAAFLWTVGQTAALISGRKTAAYLAPPLALAALLLSPAFCHGGSAEELSLFFISLPVYLFLRADAQQRMPDRRDGLLFGLCAGAVLWIKYTFLGAHIGLGVTLMAAALVKKEGRAFLRFLLNALMGFALVTAPILLWFLIRGALPALFDVYFVQNIFTYSRSAANRHAGPWESLLLNGAWTLFLPAGLAALGVRRRGWAALGLTVSFFCLFITTFIGGKTYPYYTLILARLTGPGLALPCMIPAERLPGKARIKKAFVCACVLAVAAGSVFFVWRDSPNSYLRGTAKEEMPPYRFARIISQKESPTLLNLGFLDGGFYLAAGAEPENRYFCTLNMDLPAMQEEHDRLIREGLADFLVVRSRNAAYPGYTTVDTASFPFEGREWTYHLLQYTGTDETPSDQTEQHRDRRY